MRPFSVLRARAFCHATENLDSVRSALENAIGTTEIRVSNTEGHHGNPITVLEATVENTKEIDRFFSELRGRDLEQLLNSLSSRIDDHCDLFIRLDKQAAFKGKKELGHNDDVISFRIHVRSFPSRCDVATSLVKEYLEGIRAKQTAR